MVSGQVQELPASDSLVTSSPIISSFAGTLTATAGTVRYYPPGAVQLTSVYISVGTPSSSGSVSIDVKKNGVSIFSGAYPTLAAGAYVSAPVAVNASLGSTDYLTIDVPNAGTGAADMTVFIVKN